MTVSESVFTKLTPALRQYENPTNSLVDDTGSQKDDRAMSPYRVF
jgi:hypothetical protein